MQSLNKGIERNPNFIHIEASSAKPPSFPAEIYWGTIPSGGSTGYLINPEGIEKWENWDTEFFYIHQITKADLQRYGSAPSVVCDSINKDLSGKLVFSKEPQHTIELLKELFSVVDMTPCEMLVLDLNELFLQTLRTTLEFAENAELILIEIKKQVAEEHSAYLCGGAFEGHYYSEIWKRVCSN
ncbi:MAG TPA: hypothetical protein VE732_04900, partial [Nitrososphaera sp.]|nr:hypothetical protein [Nitrososphaera sp.]